MCVHVVERRARASCKPSLPWAPTILPVPTPHVYHCRADEPKARGRVVRAVTAQEREYAAMVHRSHALCLVGRAMAFDGAASQPELQVQRAGTGRGQGQRQGEGLPGPRGEGEDAQHTGCHGHGVGWRIWRAVGPVPNGSCCSAPSTVQLRYCSQSTTVLVVSLPNTTRCTCCLNTSPPPPLPPPRTSRPGCSRRSPPPHCCCAPATTRTWLWPPTVSSRC